jgi:hypothetical protein
MIVRGTLTTQARHTVISKLRIQTITRIRHALNHGLHVSSSAPKRNVPSKYVKLKTIARQAGDDL